MTYTGHKQTYIGGLSIPEQLQYTLKQEAELHNIPMPTDKQIGLVMSALRMHNIMVHASNYDRSELGKPGQVTDFYPIESSIGRWLRDAGRKLMEERSDDE